MHAIGTQRLFNFLASSEETFSVLTALARAHSTELGSSRMGILTRFLSLEEKSFICKFNYLEPV